MQSVDDGKLLLILESFSAEMTEPLIAMKPERIIALDAVFRDSDELKTNLALQCRDAGIRFENPCEVNRQSRSVSFILRSSFSQRGNRRLYQPAVQCVGRIPPEPTGQRLGGAGSSVTTCQQLPCC